MEPATVIVTALALGAATGIKSVAEGAIKDSYKGLKALIMDRYPKIGVDRLEEKPDSENRRGAIEEDIVDTGADKDTEILQKARDILLEIEKLPEENVPSIGVSLEEVKAAALNIEDVASTGTGVSVKKSDFQDDINIKQVRAGSPDPKS